MIRIESVRGEICNAAEAAIKKAVAPYEISDITIVKKSLDARKKNDIHYVLTADFTSKSEKEILKKIKNTSKCVNSEYKFPYKGNGETVLIVGSGPAGLFCGLKLAQNGIKPIIIERGKSVEERQEDIKRLQTQGVLDTESNIQFGEGGAGTFSDGKLTTGIKDIRIKEVLRTFVAHGAPEEILYLAKPHIGTDNLKKIVKSMREEIISLGGEVRFSNKLEDLIIKNNKVAGAVVSDKNGDKYELAVSRILLAMGHSSRDSIEMLYKRGVQMVQKPFSVGARIEHKQSDISTAMYGDFAKSLPAADYKLAVKASNGRNLYTFCMCPGGTVVAAASEQGGVVTNGMSNFARDEENANSAILVGVSPGDFGSEHPLAGFEFQRRIEQTAYRDGFLAPAQRVGDFLNGKLSDGFSEVVPSYKPGVYSADLSEILPGFVVDTMREGIILMGRKIKCFADSDAVLTAPETRSSSPVRIIRDAETMKLSIEGLYSAGEGGGHAGGITSAAVDGIKAAESIAGNL